MKVVTILMIVLLAACSAPQYQSQNGILDDSMRYLPNWYHHKLGLQLLGENAYSDGPQSALLKKADVAFFQDDLQSCQIFLERAQRIAPRDASIYVRLSYLYWLQDKNAQAVQTARRALSVVGNDQMARQEVERLLLEIQKN
jgi:tetratricopeptide (TPR) repeat protein